MSCVELSDRHQAVLAALVSRHPVPDGMGDVFAELVSWGWVMASGELTGVVTGTPGPKEGDAGVRRL